MRYFIASVILLVGVYFVANRSDGMEQCLKNNSYDTCFTAINR